MSQFREALGGLASEKYLLIDLSAVPFMDSAGLGALIGGIRRAREAGGDVAVACSRPTLTRLLHTTGFDRIVSVTETVDDAAAAPGRRLATGHDDARHLQWECRVSRLEPGRPVHRVPGPGCGPVGDPFRRSGPAAIIDAEQEPTISLLLHARRETAGVPGAGGHQIRWWTVPLDGNGTGLRAGKPEAFLQTPADERHPAFSPDGRWLAYASDESGTFQTYVRAFPDAGEQVANLEQRRYVPDVVAQRARAVLRDVG